MFVHVNRKTDKSSTTVLSWTVFEQQDEYTGESSCNVPYDGNFGMFIEIVTINY